MLASFAVAAAAAGWLARRSQAGWGMARMWVSVALIALGLVIVLPAVSLGVRLSLG